MKNLFTFSLILCFIALLVNTKTHAQTPTYDLKFSRAIIVGSSELTVPNNTVWKVTSIYGEEQSTCIPVPCFSTSTLYYGKGIVTRMYVNGIFIPSTISGFKVSSTMYSDINCNSSIGGYDLACSNKTAVPSILPMWLPAGTTLKSGGPNTFVSVIEFVLQ